MSTIKTIFKKVSIGEWEKVNLKDLNTFYLIGIRGKKAKKDIIDPDAVKKIKFEIAVETGNKNKFITVAYTTINFEDISSSDVEINKATGYVRQVNMPSKFLIRATEIIEGSTSHKEGKVAIKVNINSQHLG